MSGLGRRRARPAGVDEFPLTQQFLAVMLGARRASATDAVGVLARDGAIGYRRGPCASPTAVGSRPARAPLLRDSNDSPLIARWRSTSPIQRLKRLAWSASSSSLSLRPMASMRTAFDAPGVCAKPATRSGVGTGQWAATR
jgi:hypothetical protein